MAGHFALWSWCFVSICWRGAVSQREPSILDSDEGDHHCNSYAGHWRKHFRECYRCNLLDVCGLVYQRPQTSQPRNGCGRPRYVCLICLGVAMQKSETFTALNGLRFLAALAVVIYHYGTKVEGYPRIPGIIKDFINLGPTAVSFFFILSGFVLAYRQLHGSSRIQTAGEFYWARFARLYPAYLLAFLLFLPIALQKYILSPSHTIAGRHTFILSAVLSFLMLQSWTPLAQAWNGPSWSLSVEGF